MKVWSRRFTFVLGCSLIVGCSKPPKPSPAGKAEEKGGEPVEEEGEEKIEETVMPDPKIERKRISRPDELLKLTLSGPGFDEPQVFEIEPDDSRINVIAGRSAVQFVGRDHDEVVSDDGSKLLMAQIQFGGDAPGDYEHDDKRSFVATLGVELGSGGVASMQISSGKLSAETVGQKPRELKGKLQAELTRTDDESKKTYALTAEFNLAE